MFHGFQGDVILVAGKIPVNCKAVSKTDRGFILAKGETTGHAHVVVDDIGLFEDSNGTLWINAPEEFTIQHEEHNAVQVPAGTYEVRIAKEYDHFAEEARKVMD